VTVEITSALSLESPSTTRKNLSRFAWQRIALMRWTAPVEMMPRMRPLGLGRSERLQRHRVLPFLWWHGDHGRRDNTARTLRTGGPTAACSQNPLGREISSLAPDLGELLQSVRLPSRAGISPVTMLPAMAKFLIFCTMEF
jgi:hypothetical protein